MGGPSIVSSERADVDSVLEEASLMRVNSDKFGVITISKDRNTFTAFFINLGMINEIIGLVVLLICGNQPEFLSSIFKVEWIVVFFIALYLIAKSSKRLLEYIGVIFIWAILFVVSLIITPSLKVLVVKCSFYTVICVITLAFLISLCDDPEKLVTKLSSYIWLTVIYALLTNITFSAYGVYSMQYTYSIIVTLMAYFFINKTRMLSWIVSFYLIITIVRCGSRGGLLCIGIAVLLYVLVYEKTDIKIISVILGSLIIAIIALNFFPIMLFLNSLFPASRTISYLSKGEIFYMSGRNKYYEYITNAIVNEHWKIHGIYTDRIYLGHLFGAVTSDELFGNYTHNIFMEMCYQFGGFGILLFLTLVIAVVVCGVKVKHEKYSFKILYVIAVAYSFGQLCFSSSYLTASSFGTLLGILFLIKNKDRIKTLGCN